MHLLDCKICKRLNHHLIELKKIYPTYHCRPVEGSGNLRSKICIVGLAPGLHGANKTGVPFTNDFSGNIIRQLLKCYNSDLVYITNILKCYPPKNKAYKSEINSCRKYFDRELDDLVDLKVVITLGQAAFAETIRYFKLPKKVYKFSHGKIINNNDMPQIISSYHCSKLNFNTNKINIRMLRDIIDRAFKIINNE